MVFSCLLHDQEVCFWDYTGLACHAALLRGGLVGWSVMVSLSNTYLSLVPVFAPSFSSSSRKNVSLLPSFDYLPFLANVMRSRHSYHSRLHVKLLRRYLDTCDTHHQNSTPNYFHQSTPLSKLSWLNTSTRHKPLAFRLLELASFQKQSRILPSAHLALAPVPVESMRLGRSIAYQ